MIAPTTREAARELFASKLSYEQVTPDDVSTLYCLIGIECMKHNRKRASAVRFVLPATEQNAMKIAPAESGNGIRSAFLRIDGDYFEGREAVSFNSDGFIGIAGWADDRNVQPFLRAFHKWVCEWMIGSPSTTEAKDTKSLAELSRASAVEHPGHYAGDGRIECMDAMRSMMSGDQCGLSAQSAYWWGCAFKYLWRWRRKNGVQDLQKCKQCIDYLIAETEDGD